MYVVSRLSVGGGRWFVGFVRVTMVYWLLFQSARECGCIWRPILVCWYLDLLCKYDEPIGISPPSNRGDGGSKLSDVDQVIMLMDRVGISE